MIKNGSPCRTSTIAALAAAQLFLAHSADALDVNVPSGASTATIQSAIDQVNAAGGGAVNLASGGYALTGPLNIKSNVKLNGAGNPATTVSTTVDGFSIIQNATEGLANVTIQNMKIAGSGPTLNNSGITISSLNVYHSNVIVSNVQVMNCGTMGILMKRVHGIRVVNCDIHESGGHGFQHNMYLRESTDITVSGCQMRNSPAGTGLHVAGVCTNVTVIGCTVTGNAAQGINIQDTPYTVVVRNNTISNNGFAAGNEGLGFTGNNAMIDANTANNNAGYGMYLYGGWGVVANNTATGNTLGDFNVHGQWTRAYYKLQNRATSLCADGMGRTANGANCGQWASGGSYNQQWGIVASGSYVRLKNRATGLFLDGLGQTGNGSAAKQWADSTSLNQQWTESVSVGYYRYQNAATGLFLDGMGRTANGSDLGQWSSSTSNNQQFSRIVQ